MKRAMILLCCAAAVLVLMAAVPKKAQAQAGWGGTYFPYYRGAPFYSYYTGDYGFTAPPVMRYYLHYAPGYWYHHYHPYCNPYRYWHYPGVWVHAGRHGAIYAGPVHVHW